MSRKYKTRSCKQEKAIKSNNNVDRNTLITGISISLLIITIQSHNGNMANHRAKLIQLLYLIFINININIHGKKIELDNIVKRESCVYLISDENEYIISNSIMKNITTQNAFITFNSSLFYSHAIADYITPQNVEKYKVMKENLYEFNSVMYLRQNSVYLNKLNQFIMHCRASGLIDYWEREATQLLTHTMIPNYLNMPQDQQFLQALRFQHVQHAFMLLAMGIVVSSLVFFIEVNFERIIVYCLRKTAKSLEIRL